MNRWFPTFGQLLSGRRRSSSYGLLPPYTTRLQQQSLLSVLLASAEDRVPLVPLLIAHQADERGVQKSRLNRLIHLLNDGVALPDALEQVPQLLSDEATLGIRFGMQSGILAPMLKELVDRYESSADRGWHTGRQTLGYLLAVLSCGAPIFLFMMTKISPTFVVILDDFQLERPASLSSLIEFSVWFSQLIPLLIVLLIIYALMWRFGVIRRLFGTSLLSSLSHGLSGAASAELMSDLAVATEQGRPVAGSVSTLARYHYDRTVRHRLLFVRNEAEQGMDIWSALREAKLLSTDEAISIDVAGQVGNRPWVLRQLSARRRSVDRQRWRLSSELLLPAVVIGFGAFVLWIAVAFFLPIVQIIESLS